jgi:hypothetical protein
MKPIKEIPFTPRNAAKHVVKAAVAFKVSRTVKHVIDDYTPYDEDNFLVNQGGYLIGWAVSDMVKPYTDKAVDWTADRIIAYAKKKTAEKQNTTEETK